MRAVVAHLQSGGKKAIGVGRATVTIEQIDVRKWLEQEPTAIAYDKPPGGSCHNPLLLRFFDDPDVWTLPLDDCDPETEEIFKAEDTSPDVAFIHSHQHALLIHGGRYGLYQVYKIDNPDDPPAEWKWEKIAYLTDEEIRQRIAEYLQHKRGFDGSYRKVVERTERGGIIYRHVPDLELQRLAGEMRVLCEQYLSRLAALEEEFRQSHGIR